MGGGTYSTEVYASLSSAKAYANKSSREIFSKNLKSEMSPKGVILRESRDSDEHPESLAIMVWLDVTGSMGMVPTDFVKNSMPYLMNGIFENGINHPQVFFGAIGDHEYDTAPLQIGQYESETQLLDHWLTSVWLEGGGGGNRGESYLLSWLFASMKTSIDCFEKRGQKGFLFTIGDEPCLPSISKYQITEILGNGQYKDTYSAKELLSKARETYNVYHIHVNHKSIPLTKVEDHWRDLIGENLIITNDYRKIADIMAKVISSNYNNNSTTGEESKIEASWNNQSIL